MKKDVLIYVILIFFIIFFELYVFIFYKIEHIKNDVVIAYIEENYSNIDIDKVKVSKRIINLFSDKYSFYLKYEYLDSVAYVYNYNGKYIVKLDDSKIFGKNSYDELYDNSNNEFYYYDYNKEEF